MDGQKASTGIQVPDGRHPRTYEKARWFDYEHLPSQQRQVSAEFARLAHKVILMFQDGEQLWICLQHLIDAKDAAVRQSIVDADTPDMIDVR